MTLLISAFLLGLIVGVASLSRRSAAAMLAGSSVDAGRGDPAVARTG